jgi:hypothetical protein
MGIRDRPTSFRSPWQNGYVERLIGSIRRECTDHLIVFNAEHLRQILAKYATYYNEVRTHVSLGKDAPYTRQIERFGDIVAHPILGGLHHRYARIWFSEATALVCKLSPIMLAIPSYPIAAASFSLSLYCRDPLISAPGFVMILLALLIVFAGRHFVSVTDTAAEGRKRWKGSA